MYLVNPKLSYSSRVVIVSFVKKLMSAIVLCVRLLERVMAVDVELHGSS